VLQPITACEELGFAALECFAFILLKDEADFSCLFPECHVGEGACDDCADGEDRGWLQR
jgi:hypothetical protein